MASPRPHSEANNEVESLLYRIHASADARDDWRSVLELLTDRLGGRLATLSRHHIASGQGSVICEFPDSPSFRNEYPQFASRNPWFLSSETFTPGSVMTGDELLSNREFVKTDFYRCLLKPRGLLHCLSGVAARRGHVVHYVTVHRGEGDAAYGERDKAGLRAILAHVSLALENRWRLRESLDLTRVLMGILDRQSNPSLIVDADGRIVHCNRSASALSVPGTGLSIDGGQLQAATAIDRAALREAIREVARAARSDVADATRAVTLTVPGTRYPAIVSVHAAGRIFRAASGDVDELVLVTARSPHVEHEITSCAFVKKFGLSPAQARVSVRIFTGHSLADTARTLHLSENTVRSHLKQVFQKTNTHSQMELVHLHAMHCAHSDDGDAPAMGSRAS
jgi:DNA-binding CsgD family transcriptional regulator